MLAFAKIGGYAITKCGRRTKCGGGKIRSLQNSAPRSPMIGVSSLSNGGKIKKAKSPRQGLAQLTSDELSYAYLKNSRRTLFPLGVLELVVCGFQLLKIALRQGPRPPTTHNQKGKDLKHTITQSHTHSHAHIRYFRLEAVFPHFWCASWFGTPRTEHSVRQSRARADFEHEDNDDVNGNSTRATAPTAFRKTQRERKEEEEHLVSHLSSSADALMACFSAACSARAVARSVFSPISCPIEHREQRMRTRSVSVMIIYHALHQE